MLQRGEVVSDVAAVRAHLTTRLGASKAMAIVGVSAGGHIAFLAATRLRFALAVTIYGGWMVDGGIPLAEPAPPVADCAALAANGCFFLGIAAGGRDRLITAEQWRRLDVLLDAAGVERELVRYAGARHGFLCAERSVTFDAEASADVWRRWLGALAAHMVHAQRPADGQARAHHLLVACTARGARPRGFPCTTEQTDERRAVQGTGSARRGRAPRINCTTAAAGGRPSDADDAPRQRQADGVGRHGRPWLVRNHPR